MAENALKCTSCISCETGVFGPRCSSCCWVSQHARTTDERQHKKYELPGLGACELPETKAKMTANLFVLMKTARKDHFLNPMIFTISLYSPLDLKDTMNP